VPKAVLFPPPKAVLFDVFGTLVDWRGSVCAALTAIGAAAGIDADWQGLTDAWRGRYRPAMDAVRRGERPFAILDTLHRESIVALLPEYGAQALVPQADGLVAIWHRLTPWPDAAPGLAALNRTHITAPLSNGNIALLVALARHGGLTFDTMFGGDVSGHYKPDPQTYLTACRLLNLAPGEVMLAAAHNEDLAAARALGLRTAFISRPMEFGAPDHRAQPDQDWDILCHSVTALAARLA
jgi:2-haloacid dehalogenase